jgi:hypothetical protein
MFFFLLSSTSAYILTNAYAYAYAIPALADGLSKSKSLTSLSLAGNNLYNRDTVQLAASLRAGSSSLVRE